MPYWILVAPSKLGIRGSFSIKCTKYTNMTPVWAGLFSIIVVYTNIICGILYEGIEGFSFLYGLYNGL